MFGQKEHFDRVGSEGSSGDRALPFTTPDGQRTQGTDGRFQKGTGVDLQSIGQRPRRVSFARELLLVARG